MFLKLARILIMKGESIMVLCNVLKSILVVSVAGIAIAVIVPVFVADQFRTGGESMSPILETGDHILVDKLLMGARIYTAYDFTVPELKSFRMPGIRRVRPGDVAVFNYPEGWEKDRIGFRINYVYTKRCIGCPGDTVRIENGFYRNSSCPDEILGSEVMQSILSGTPDSLLVAQGVFLPAMPFRKEFGWTIRDFGPLYIPGRSDSVRLDDMSVRLYRKIIEYETDEKVEVRDGMVYIGGSPANTYTFEGNYYFFGGDNVLNSKDSRYVGLVPEEFIVGIATRILFSVDPDTGAFRRDRFMKRIK